MLRLSLFMVTLALLLGLSACATPPRSVSTPSVSIKAGRSVAVQQGETLYSFARRNGASMREIIDLNRLQAPFVLSGGTVLKLPKSDNDLPSIELGAVAKENEEKYKQKHRGKPATIYTQVAPEPLPQEPPAPLIQSQTAELHAEAKNQFNKSASDPNTEITSATAALNLKPLEFDEARKHLVETNKPPTKPAQKPEKLIDKKSKVAKTLGTKELPGKPDPNDLEIPVPSKLPSDVKKITPKVEAKVEPKPELKIEPKIEPEPVTVIDQKKPQPELHSRIEKAAEPKNLIWPVQGQVISTYGPKSTGLKNDGINIAVPRGSPVLAADGGTVAYAGSDIPGYGNVVLVRHPNGLMTTYAHLERMFVQENIVVAKGDLLGTVGTSGGVDTPQLHFEIRRDKEALDPSKYLYR